MIFGEKIRRLRERWQYYPIWRYLLNRTLFFLTSLWEESELAFFFHNSGHAIFFFSSKNNNLPVLLCFRVKSNRINAKAPRQMGWWWWWEGWKHRVNAKKERGRLSCHICWWQPFCPFLQILVVSLFSFLLLCLTSGLFYGCHLFIVIFPIFFILCSRSCTAAFAGQYKLQLFWIKIEYAIQVQTYGQKE
jgi:hypothetical protein